MSKINTLAELKAKHRSETVALLRAALRRAGGRVQVAAEALGIPQPTLHRYVRETYPELSADANPRPGATITDTPRSPP